MTVTLTAPASCPPGATVPESWNPRLDPYLRDAWLAWLIDHRDEWVHVGDVWRCEDDWQRIVLAHVAWETVCLARHLGHEIDGDRSLGYCWRGSRLVTYVHVREDVEEPDAAQLTLTP